MVRHGTIFWDNAFTKKCRNLLYMTNFYMIHPIFILTLLLKKEDRYWQLVNLVKLNGVYESMTDIHSYQSRNYFHEANISG